MTKSLAKTLAAKRKKSVAWVYRTYKYKFETGVTGFRLVIDRKPPKNVKRQLDSHINGN
jgi:hypothetical protein